MSNYFCYNCGGLVDVIGLNPSGVKFCDCAKKIEALRAKVAELESRSDDIQDIASKALRKAWQLGQTYWQQMDSEYSSQWKKGEITQAKFMELIDETRSAIDSAMKGEK